MLILPQMHSIQSRLQQLSQKQRLDARGFEQREEEPVRMDSFLSMLDSLGKVEKVVWYGRMMNSEMVMKVRSSLHSVPSCALADLAFDLRRHG